MPRSDNLYSADDSDGESFSDELSPSDGYFNPPAMPGQRMVQDPSLDTKEVEPKTLMPTPNPQSRTGGTSRTSLHSVLPQSNTSHGYVSPYPGSNASPSPSPSSYTPLSPVSSNRREPLLPGRSLSTSGPPPAYSPPQSPMTPAPRIATYRTFPDQYLERSLLPVREPQSMGRPSEAPEPSENTPLTNQSSGESPYKRCKGFFHSRETQRRVLKRFLLAALVFFVVTSILAIMGGGDYPPSKPGKNPDTNPGNFMPTSPSKSYCARAKHHIKPIAYEFPSEETLTVIQSIQKDDWHHGYVRVETAGQIIVRRYPKEFKNGTQGRLDVDIYVSDPDLPIIKTWDAHSKVFEIKTPIFAPLPSSVRQCVSVELTVWIPEDAEFTNLNIEAVTLNLSVLEDVKVSVKENSKFSTITGDIHFPNFDLLSQISKRSSGQERDANSLESTHPFSSRWIEVKTISGSISGTYPLRDYLGLSSQSGDIKVSVDPQPALPSSPLEFATLDINTASGDITTNLPIASSYTPPPRKYITQARTQSGTISGTYYIGSKTSFQGTSSAIKLTALPILELTARERSIPFETISVSGTIDIQVLDPIFLTLQNNNMSPYTPNPIPIRDNDPYLLIPNTLKIPKLRSLDATHTSTSSDIKIRYPSAWEGTVSATTMSGGITASGERLKIIRDKKGYVNKQLVALKGVNAEGEGGAVNMASMSGDLKFVVGS